MGSISRRSVEGTSAEVRAGGAAPRRGPVAADCRTVAGRAASRVHGAHRIAREAFLDSAGSRIMFLCLTNSTGGLGRSKLDNNRRFTVKKMLPFDLDRASRVEGRGWGCEKNELFLFIMDEVGIGRKDVDRCAWVRGTARIVPVIRGPCDIDDCVLALNSS
ncbi:hypothetical protein EVAR_82832_1 [Eumeta japonica]|uniref:Uncharacterized protein n=1 Tax=Eumeta variegata TaxID=151549 RepID=A0A4C1V4R0_EUMVA|nr:hypothetical protein EVAR_82832_1 [Eumeta japonica]